MHVEFTHLPKRQVGTSGPPNDAHGIRRFNRALREPQIFVIIVECVMEHERNEYASERAVDVSESSTAIPNGGRSNSNEVRRRMVDLIDLTTTPSTPPGRRRRENESTSSSTSSVLLGGIVGGIGGALVGHLTGEGIQRGAARGAALGASTGLATNFYERSSSTTSTTTHGMTRRRIVTPLGIVEVVSGTTHAHHHHPLHPMLFSTHARRDVQKENEIRARCASNVGRTLRLLDERAQYSSSSMMSDDLCSICLSEFESDSEKIELPCGHVFHRDEIRTWFESQGKGALERSFEIGGTIEHVVYEGRPTCPNCKADVLEALEKEPIVVD